MLLVCLLNGTPFLIGRIGVLDPTNYTADRQRFCPSSGPPAGLVSACAPVLPAEAHEHQDGFERLSLRRLHATPGYWGLLKVLRLLLMIGCSMFLLLGMVQGHWSWPGWQPMLPALPFLVGSAIGLFVALPQAPLMALISGMRSMAWLPLLVLSGPASQLSALAQLARAMALLILLQIPLSGLEAIWGLPMSLGRPLRSWLRRVWASQPGWWELSSCRTALAGSGVPAGFLLGCTLPQRRVLVPVALAAMPVVMLARSGTGLLIWVVLVAFWAGRAWCSHLAMKLISLTLLAPFALATPLLLGRSDLWQSLSGRLSIFNAGMASSSSWQLLFGQGFLHGWEPDSLPAQLLLVGGLLALFAFYGLLAWAWCHDHQARPFLLAVSLSSLTLTIDQLFPINFLLALSVNRSLTLTCLSQKRS